MLSGDVFVDSRSVGSSSVVPVLCPTWAAISHAWHHFAGRRRTNPAQWQRQQTSQAMACAVTSLQGDEPLCDTRGVTENNRAEAPPGRWIAALTVMSVRRSYR